MSIIPQLPDSNAYSSVAGGLGDGRERESRINPELASAFYVLENTGYPWLLLRGESDLLRPAGDVDLLVSRRLLPRLDQILEAAGFLRVTAHGHGSHRFYFRYIADEDLWIKLDIVSDIAFGQFQEMRTGLAAGCLRRRVAHGPLWLPEPHDQAWLQILHLVLDKRQIASQRIAAARAAGAVATASDPVATFLDRKFGQGKAESLLDMLRSGSFHQVPGAATALSRNWEKYTSSPRIISLTNRVLRRIGPRLTGRGPVIGVLAPDGAGKTTLLDSLRTHCPLPSAYVYMGLWAGSPHDPLIQRIPGAVLVRKVFRILRGGLTARYASLRGRVVLMDRLAEDTLLADARSKSRLGALTDAFALKLQPTPNLVLVLDAPGELMFRRKGEHSPQKLEEWRAAYLRLAAELPSACIVDASQPVIQVRRDASRLLWRMAAADQTEVPGDSGPLALHLWTLLDWRFLLPVAQPGRVGYGGSMSPDAAKAIGLLDPSASHIAMDGRTGQQAEFDLVLLSLPNRQLLEKGVGSLRAGGWMCLQIHPQIFVRSGPRTLRGWKRVLERCGFDDVAVYWLVPTLEHPERVVPTDSEAAVKDTISHYSGARFGRAKAPVARLALRLGLFNTVAPAGMVVGRRTGETGGEETK
ncbi:thymidylate kinase [Arthrobacter sp. B2I5]|uniref:hypothetical protein n=1 Tax=Arthrobacter sp. B2I5 TaxID=3042266 RepID=UPI00277FDD28|nr:hypothetical protein [Arthrobacter sp. B2I5]MDQ0827971.1 thymidylate kinase [Arthrobacter sp. B2I5]